MSLSPFAFVNSISYDKKNLLLENDESEYNPFIVNRSLSYFLDTIFHSNEMNIHHKLDKKMQYDYLRLSIRPNKRFSKWIKREDSENLDAIQKFYSCNSNRAIDILKLLTEEQIEKIKDTFSKGG